MLRADWYCPRFYLLSDISSSACYTGSLNQLRNYEFGTRYRQNQKYVKIRHRYLLSASKEIGKLKEILRKRQQPKKKKVHPRIQPCRPYEEYVSFLVTDIYVRLWKNSDLAHGNGRDALQWLFATFCIHRASPSSYVDSRRRDRERRSSVLSLTMARVVDSCFPTRRRMVAIEETMIRHLVQDGHGVRGLCRGSAIY